MERAAQHAALAGEAWTLSDGHAGNVRQAVALASALELANTHAVALAPRAPWRWLAPRLAPGSRHAFGLDFSRALATPPALAIGCGRQAALATRLLRAAGSRVVQILDPRLDPKHWDLVVAPEHDALAGENVITLVGSLHPVDDAWLAQAREGFDLFAQLPAPRTTLLVGGPTAQSRYDEAALGRDLGLLAGRMRAERGSVLVTTSRRTPDAWRQVVQRALADIPGVRWFAPASGDAGEDNPYPGMLAWADRIVCTPDSVNMISEACATRVPVLVPGMEGSDGRLRRFHESLRASGRVHGLGEEAWSTAAVAPLRETVRVARVVRDRLGLDAGEWAQGAHAAVQAGTP
jgi:mitochondrial fission protein ELM1